MLNRTPIPAMVAGMTIVGFLAIFMGLLAEMNTRIYYESQRKPIYSVREVIEPAHKKEEVGSDR
jgi:hypothetical protein